MNPAIVKQIDDILNDPECDKKLDKLYKVLNNADMSNKKDEADMTDDTKTTEQTNDQVKADSTSKKTINPFGRERLADILWNASTKHPFITLGLISGALMLGGFKLTEYVVSRGVYTGNMKTLKTIYRMTH